MRRLVLFLSAVTLFAAMAVQAIALEDPVEPSMVDDTLFVPGEPLTITKTVVVPAIPQHIDVCLLEDESGSFIDDIGNLQGGTTASDIFDDVKAEADDAQFAVAGFRDYPSGSFGSAGDHVYRLLSTMSSTKAAWLAGIALLSASGGADFPEAQYDAIVAAAGPGPFTDPTLGSQPNCGWRTGGGITRVLVVTTDATFHGPDGTHVNDHTSTLAALNAEDIIVVGLTAPGSGGELAALAAATGGSTQALSSNGANIADAILAGLEELTTTITVEDDCDPLEISFDPAFPQEEVSGGAELETLETIELAEGVDPADLEKNPIHCTVEFSSDGEVFGTQDLWITIGIVCVPGEPCELAANDGDTSTAQFEGEGIDGTVEVKPLDDPGDCDGEDCDTAYDVIFVKENANVLGEMTVVVFRPEATPPGKAKVFIEDPPGSGNLTQVTNKCVGKSPQLPCQKINRIKGGHTQYFVKFGEDPRFRFR